MPSARRGCKFVQYGNPLYRSLKDHHIPANTSLELNVLFANMPTLEPCDNTVENSIARQKGIRYAKLENNTSSLNTLINIRAE
jgi:hypothetical protein